MGIVNILQLKASATLIDQSALLMMIGCVSELQCKELFMTCVQAASC